MARPARLGDDQLRIVVEVGTTINETIILYTNSMFLIVEEAAIPIIPGFDRNILFRSTDSVTVMLRVEQVSSSTLQPSLQFDNELDQSLNISLSNNNLSSRGLEECDEEPNSYIPINIIVPGVSEAGQYRFDIVARFTSTVNETEENLRLNNRFVNVTHALRVDLEGQCVCNIAYVYMQAMILINFSIFHSHKHHSYNCQYNYADQYNQCFSN